MRDFLYFDSMITPKIITFIYWLLLVLVGFSGLAMLVSSLAMMGNSFFMGLLLLLATPIVVAVMVVVARVYCELMIVIFKMNEALQEIRLK